MITNKIPEHVSIVEVGPRDGLQNEKSFVSTCDKIKLINQLSQCGFDTIETTSFVSPKWMPQLADAVDVMANITRYSDVCYSALVPNIKGYELALSSSADEIAIFASASEGFSQKNINCSISESLERFKTITEQAIKDEIPIRGYVSCVIECPYDGVTKPESVANVTSRLLELGCYEVSLGDTVGVGVEDSVRYLLDHLSLKISADLLAGHFHDTNQNAIENIGISLEYGLRRFDSSIGGLGGCPYAPGAKGNVATTDVVQFLHHKGYSTNIDLDKLSMALDVVNEIKVNM